MPRGATKPARFLFALTALAALLSACGGESGDGAPGKGGAAATAHGDVHEASAAPTAAKLTRELGNFLNRGPTSGTWTITSPNKRRTLVLAPHPSEDQAVLVLETTPSAKATLDQPGAPADTAPLEAFSRWAVPLHFFEAPAWLFLANYRVEGEPVAAPLPGHPDAVLLAWRPNHEDAGATERRVWFTGAGDAVLRIEDRSRAGHPLRTVVHDAGSPIRLTPTAEELAVCCRRDPPNVVADDIRRALEAPFPVYEPAHLPPGFKRIRADYRAHDLDPEDGEEEEIRCATLLYSDGMALISVAIAPRAHMNAILRHYGKMSAREGDPESCPGLPANPEQLNTAAAVIRRRSDACRIVLRRDDLPGNVSYMMLGRNELRAEVYLDAIGHLQAVAKD